MSKIILVCVLLLAAFISPLGLFAQEDNQYVDRFQEDVKNELHILRAIIKDVQKNQPASSSQLSTVDYDEIMQQFEAKLETRLAEFKIQLNEDQASQSQNAKNTKGNETIDNNQLYLLLGGTLLLSILISFMIAKSVAKSSRALPNNTQ
jgi:hypothetical protein